MGWMLLLLGATVFVAYANGANDNFKGVATLFGSGTTGYRRALAWATVTTLAGSLTAFFFATRLIATFSGQGLLPGGLITAPEFLSAVVLGAGATVLSAARTGIPISTTHSLTGALVGAGLAAAGPHLGFSTLGKSFVLPLAVSPVIAVVGTLGIYPLFRRGRRRLGVERNTCVCLGERVVPASGLACPDGRAIPAAQLRALDIFVDEKDRCEVRAVQRYSGRVLGVDAQGMLDRLHFLSAGAVGFARGLNDTPKIVALSAAAGVLGLKANVGLVAAAMAVGGIVSAGRVARTMAHRVTAMNPGQGFTANLVTAILVIFASRWGVPVSTTHVSCGSLFGIGLANGEARWKVIGGIVAAWVLTLPIAAAFSAAFYLGLRAWGGRG